MKTFLKRMGSTLQMMRLILTYEPAYIGFALPSIVIASILPLLGVYAPKLILEKLMGGSNYIDILRVIGLYVAALLLLRVIGKWLTGKLTLLGDRFTKKVRAGIGQRTMKLSFAEVESASYREVILLAGKAGELTSIFGLIQQICAKIITIAGLVTITVTLDPLFLMILAFVFAAKIVFTVIKQKYNEKARILYAKNDREGNYLSRVAYFDQGAEKELRVGSLENWFMSKIKKYRKTMLQLQYKDFRYAACFEIVMYIILAIQTLLVLLLLANKYMDSEISIADFTMYFSAVTALVTAMTALTDEIGNYNRQMLGMGDYGKLVALETESLDGVFGYANTLPQKNSFEIKFEDVSFAYPNTGKTALCHINLTIKDKEKLVVVGQNGAGKTTFIKLLCKFYKPTEGKITLNGIDIWTIPNTEYYRLLAAVFQDYQNFAFSFTDSIVVGGEYNEEKLSTVLYDVGLHTLMERLPDGYNTYITKNFSKDGIEPSGGESQKLAIARAQYKDAPILILDEPTASLDAKAEDEIYRNLFRMAKNKTSVFISHRLAASTIADKIAVFAEGKLKEYGDHATLISRKGLYAEMHQKQSEGYK